MDNSRRAQRLVSRRAAHEELDLYKVAKRFAVEMYDLTRSFPPDEKFGLVGQIRRAAVSIPSNIAEGAARGSRKEFSRFLLIARGSANELRVLLEISEEIGLLRHDRTQPVIHDLERVLAMLSGLIRSTVRASQLTSTK